jgi:hypothetical protein
MPSAVRLREVFRPGSFARLPVARGTSTRAGGFCRWLRLAMEWILLILGREHHAAEFALERFERSATLAFRIQHIAEAAKMGPSRSKEKNLLFVCNRRQIQMLPASLAQNMAGEIVLV